MQRSRARGPHLRLRHFEEADEARDGTGISDRSQTFIRLRLCHVTEHCCRLNSSIAVGSDVQQLNQKGEPSQPSDCLCNH